MAFGVAGFTIGPVRSPFPPRAVYPLPAPKAPTPDEVRQDPLAERYGVDLALTHDLLVLANGDVARISGAAVVRENFVRSLLTRPGELLWRPDYGVGLQDFLNQPISASLKERIRNRIRSTLASSPQIESVDQVEIEVGDHQVRVEVVAILAGARQDFALEIRREAA